MSFAWPHLLWLVVVPVALLIWELSRRRRTDMVLHPKILRAEAGDRGLSLVNRAEPVNAGGRARPWLWAGLALAFVAIARPQWGRLEEPVFDQSREILLAVDLSRSMLAPDVKPSRLDRAKLLIQSLLERLVGERVGLVVFSGTAFLQSPLSADYEILREFLPSLGPEFLPEGGTNYRALIDTALQAFGSTNTADRFLIVLSDGEATDDDWKPRISELKTKGIRVIGLGVGTAEGAMIPDGAGGLVKDERGAVVLSKLESGTLQELAQVTGGVYRDASAWIDIAGLLKETIEAGRKGQFLEKNTVRLVERFQWPLAFGLWCLFVSLCYEFPVRPRPRDLKLAFPAPANRKPAASPVGVAALLFLIGALWPHQSAQAAATLQNPPATPPPLPAPAIPQPLPLAKIVGRLSVAASPTARDWAELARETVTWGSQLLSEKQPVPEGPVRDALKAVDLGAKINPTTADWAKLREELEALLIKNDEQKDDQKQKQDQQQQNKDQKNKDQKDQDQQKDQSPDEKKSDPNQPEDQKNSDQKKENQPENQNDKPEQPPKPGESAFGDMNQKDQPPPPPPGDTQKVGGAPEKKEESKETADPALALPLQKLDQLRNQDSPARLFELMEGERKSAPKKSGKNW